MTLAMMQDKSFNPYGISLFLFGTQATVPRGFCNKGSKLFIQRSPKIGQVAEIARNRFFYRLDDG